VAVVVAAVVVVATATVIVVAVIIVVVVMVVVVVMMALGYNASINTTTAVYNIQLTSILGTNWQHSSSDNNWIIINTTNLI
jgi:hypothetical protein